MTQSYLNRTNGQVEAKPSQKPEGSVFTPLSVLLNGTRSPLSLFPRVNITRSDDAIHVTAFVPGVEKSELELSIEERELTIAGSRVLAVSEEDVIAEERFFGNFKRILKLPEAVDVENVVAHHENGVIKITFPRLKSNQKTTIEIQ